ncbi:hypothetical protein BOTCAL_0524g00030 [Botryotinia calthae]|uniref:Uncharacterized protein n=1 Tax=Botryotinia calthae TaxID=38488 RepID=A0A4Y8CKP4_9HELO|nr:hypothetical protein BOTCAL_0524g00030 [Botryotinia calthae]
MRHLLFPDPLPNYQRQSQHSNKNFGQNFKPQSCQTGIRYSQHSTKTARQTLTDLNDQTDDSDDCNIDCEDFDYESEYFREIFVEIIRGLHVKQRAIEFKHKDIILERLPNEIRQMIFVFCGRNTFCSADQGPRLLEALRGQRSAYTHALIIFQRLNSYELGVELKTRTSEIRHNVHDMIGLMTVDKTPRNVSPQSNSNNSELAESDLKLTLHGRISEDHENHGDFWASTPSTVLYDLVRQLHNADRIRDVQFSQEMSFPTEWRSRIILCQNDQGDWTFLKNFLTLVPCRRVKRVIIQLPNPKNYRINPASRYDKYYRDNHYESYRAKQDAFVLAVIESINQKVGVRGVVLGRSKDSLSGFCIWESPEGKYMNWHHDVIEPWALRGGFGKTFLDYENNFLELSECKKLRCFVVNNRRE